MKYHPDPQESAIFFPAQIVGFESANFDSRDESRVSLLTRLLRILRLLLAPLSRLNPRCIMIHNYAKI